MRFVFTYPCDNEKVGVKHDLFYIFLHKVYLYAHYYKVCVLKYIKIGGRSLAVLFSFFIIFVR